MPRAISAALLYFATIFTAGFVMGTLRTLWIAPNIGLLLATAIELPVMLVASWMACGLVLRRLAVPSEPIPRLCMSALAFALLLVAEALLSVLLGGLSLSQHIALYQTTPVLLGLAGQLAFAFFPLIRN